VETLSQQHIFTNVSRIVLPPSSGSSSPRRVDVGMIMLEDEGSMIL